MSDMEVDTAAPLPFALRATLSGHEQDVRSVGSTADGAIITGSRDASVRVWREQEGAAYESTALLGHTHYVGAVGRGADGGVVSGSNDKHVIEWDLSAGAPSRVLQGHKDVVSCVSSSASGALLSASWDKTVRVWKGGECVATLAGHEAAVWAVLPLDDDERRVLTASAHQTSRRWLSESGECFPNNDGHTDVYRSMANLQGVGFLSASNDGSVRLWELGGECLRVLHASDSFVYSVAVLPSGEWMTCSEDRTVRVWDGQSDSCVQSMTHPSTVWACAPLANGEIVAGCADGNAYVWSRDPARAAPLDAAAAFKEAVAAVALPAEQGNAGMLGDLDTPNLLLPPSLTFPHLLSPSLRR